MQVFRLGDRVVAASVVSVMGGTASEFHPPFPRTGGVTGGTVLEYQFPRPRPPDSPSPRARASAHALSRARPGARGALAPGPVPPDSYLAQVLGGGVFGIVVARLRKDVRGRGPRGGYSVKS